ncbi:chaperone binding [Forsythia ovata]|uniref:Chaperone binding n=1 Tax=Forsythia ovata TaxID=205694 RepID=A0ABD1SRR6_9LAMI
MEMEGGGAASVSAEKVSESADAASYTYWIREMTPEAAPLPVPKKLNPEELSNQSNKTHLGSAWNGAGTWEEKSLNKWATDRIKELLGSMGSLEFSGGRAEASEVTKCSGDAFLVTVRNKKRVGYTYELTLKVKGEWLVGGQKKKVKGHIDVFEFSFGELDDLQINVKLSEDKDLPQQDKQQICQDLKLFLQPLRKKLLQFEQELKGR